MTNYPIYTGEGKLPISISASYMTYADGTVRLAPSSFYPSTSIPEFIAENQCRSSNKKIRFFMKEAFYAFRCRNKKKKLAKKIVHSIIATVTEDKIVSKTLTTTRD